MRYGSFFTGIGGLDLAVELVTDAEPVFHCEPDFYCGAVLRQHWPGVHNFGPIEEVTCKSIWSVLGSRARARPPQENDSVSRTTDPRFGTSSSAFFASYDPDSHSWRTPQASLLPDEDSTGSSLTWPRSGTMRSGRVWARETLARPTAESASSSSPYTYPYPTPSATSYGTSGNGTGNNTVSRGRPSLDTIAKKWPTPLAVNVGNPDTSPRDPKRGARLQDTAAAWPTPLASDSDGPKHPRSGDRRDNPRPNLPAKTRAWPTPVTTDAKDAARSTTNTGIMHPGSTLTDTMRGRQAPSKPKSGDDTMVLVPEFVEALMGLPEGWTLVADDAASSILATAALPSREGSHSPSSPCDYEVGG